MAAPSSPYCEPGHIAALAYSYKNKSIDDFTSQTTPKYTDVESSIVLICGQIDMQFASAGYKVPFIEISGETWPAHQTIYLRFLAAMGSHALIIGHAQNPTRALKPGELASPFQELYNNEMARIFTPGRFPGEGQSFIRLRAQAYAGTPAEWSLAIPKGPTTDFMENRHDPLSKLSVWDTAICMTNIQRTFESMDLDWNYVYGAFDIDKGFVYTRTRTWQSL